MFNESLLMDSGKEGALQAGCLLEDYLKFGLKYLSLRNRNYKCDCSVIIYL